VNDLQIFKNSEFGELGVLVIGGREYFPASACAKTLGYVDATNAIKLHCRWVVKHHIPHPQSPDKIIEQNFIPEGDLYRLIIRSKLPEAERFERWVFDEVLPSIRKVGAYVTPEAADKFINDPDSFIEALIEIKRIRARQAELSPI
jgi:anti-repressor protein